MRWVIPWSDSSTNSNCSEVNCDPICHQDTHIRNNEPRQVSVTFSLSSPYFLALSPTLASLNHRLPFPSTTPRWSLTFISLPTTVLLIFFLLFPFFFIPISLLTSFSLLNPVWNLNSTHPTSSLSPVEQFALNDGVMENNLFQHQSEISPTLTPPPHLTHSFNQAPN